VEFEDERLTTRIAERQVGASGLPRSRRQEKGRLDEAAAVLILESYLRRVKGQE
jgi:putative Holliday junction resolvase